MKERKKVLMCLAFREDEQDEQGEQTTRVM